MLSKRVYFQRQCTRCNHKWFPKQWDEEKNKQIDPKTCPNPKCKSLYWNKEPIRPHSKATKNKLKESWKKRRVYT